MPPLFATCLYCVLWSIALALVAIVAALAVLFYFKPILLVRAFTWVLRHTFYRLRVIGNENIPATGPVLLVCNHVSYLDFLFLLTAQKRYIHFVIFAGWTKIWGLQRLFKMAGVIPIDKSAGPRALVQSLRQAGEALARGEVVCIFAEGRFTRTGFLLQFRRGFEQIVKHCPAPIVPVCLQQVWGSIFSYWRGKLIWKWPLEIPYPVTVAFGPPLAPNAAGNPAGVPAPAEVRQAVQKLSADCAIERSARTLPVHRQFVRTATRWRQFFKACVIDAEIARSQSLRRGTLTYGQMLTEGVCTARALRSRWGADDSRLIGVWLPPGLPAALANLAIALLGKGVVNLDVAAPFEKTRAVIDRCQLRRVITSRELATTIPFPSLPDVELIYLEDIAAQITPWQRLRLAAAGLLLPNFIFDRWVLGLGRHKGDDLLSILFPDGGKDSPRGIPLSHRNVAANIASLTQVIDASPRDRLLGLFPFSDALGFTATLWLPLVIGASVVYESNPRAAKQVGSSCKQSGCTILLSTPDWLGDFLASCAADDFASLRFLWCGGERLSPELAQQFAEKFKIVPLLGYGQAELSPAATLNVPDRDLDGFKQVGNRPGTIGQALPGVAARIVDPAFFYPSLGAPGVAARSVDPVSFAPLPPGQPGLLQFYGANVMAGYLDDPTATQQALRDGWFSTGLTATMDDDGFITLVS